MNAAVETVDFRITDQGDIWLFEPVTENAKTFVSDEVQVEGWQWMGNAFGVDRRIADGFAGQLEGNGFSVEYN